MVDAAGYGPADASRGLDAGLRTVGDTVDPDVWVFVIGRDAESVRAAVAKVGGEITHVVGAGARARVPRAALARLAGEPGILQVRQSA